MLARCARHWATVRRFALVLSLAPRHHRLQLERRSGKRRRDRRSRIRASDISVPLSPLKRLVVGAGMRATRKPGCGEGLLAARRADSLAACLQLLQVASVNLDLTDSQLDGQDVADDACMVIASPTTAARVIPLRGGWTTFASPFRDPQYVYGIPKSTARARGLHQPQVERARLATLLAERTDWRRGFLYSAGSPFLFLMAPHARLVRAGASRTDLRLPSVHAIRSTLSTSRHWKRSSAIPLVRIPPRARARRNQQPLRGHHSVRPPAS